MRRFVDAFALLAVVGAAIVLWDPVLPWLRDGVIHVSPDGSDWNRGASPADAVATLRYAAELARPGDVVLIAPGVYRERVKITRGGEPGRPIVWRAAAPGTVTISGAASVEVCEALRWRDEGGGVFSAATPWPVHRAEWKGLALARLHFHDAASFREVCARPSARGGYQIRDGRLHVGLPGGVRPGRGEIVIHDPVPPLGPWWGLRGANVLVEADHLRFEGLRFEHGVGASLRLEGARHVEVLDCVMSGATVGVAAGAGADGLRIVHCLFHNDPQRFWRDGWLSWREAYPASSATLVRTTSDDVEIRGNLVLHAADGMGVSSGEDPVDAGALVTENLIAWCTDDAIELDGFARKVRFLRNLVYDSYQSLGTSPVLAGPVLVENNLFLHPDGLNGSQIKLLSMKRPGFEGPIRDVTLRRNTFVGRRLLYHGGHPIEDVVVEDNVFATRFRRAWPDGVTARDNLMIDLGEDASANPCPDPGLDPRWRSPMTTDDGRPVGAATPDGWSIPRPGPRWLDWSSSDVTRPLVRHLAPDLFDPVDPDPR